MRNAGLDEAQSGIKIIGKNIHKLSFTDDTTLMAESEEEKNLLMKVKEEGPTCRSGGAVGGQRFRGTWVGTCPSAWPGATWSRRPWWPRRCRPWLSPMHSLQQARAPPRRPRRSLGGSSAPSPAAAPLTTRPGSWTRTCAGTRGRDHLFVTMKGVARPLSGTTISAATRWFTPEKSPLFVQLVAVNRNSTQNQTWRNILNANMKTSRNNMHAVLKVVRRPLRNISSWKPTSASTPTSHCSSVPKRDVENTSPPPAVWSGMGRSMRVGPGAHPDRHSSRSVCNTLI